MLILSFNFQYIPIDNIMYILYCVYVLSLQLIRPQLPKYNAIHRFTLFPENRYIGIVEIYYFVIHINLHMRKTSYIICTMLIYNSPCGGLWTTSTI